MCHTSVFISLCPLISKNAQYRCVVITVIFIYSLDIMEESNVFEFSTNVPEASYIVGTDGFEKDLANVKQEYTELDKVDYKVRTQDVKEPMPMSYLSVSTLEEGEEWYRQHYPQMPEELLPMLSRYSFGDLGTWTNKELNDYKATCKKRDSMSNGKIEFKHEPITLSFP